jgi:hypothetical protein
LAAATRLLGIGAANATQPIATANHIIDYPRNYQRRDNIRKRPRCPPADEMSAKQLSRTQRQNLVHEQPRNYQGEPGE